MGVGGHRGRSGSVAPPESRELSVAIPIDLYRPHFGPPARNAKKWPRNGKFSPKMAIFPFFDHSFPFSQWGKNPFFDHYFPLPK